MFSRVCGLSALPYSTSMGSLAEQNREIEQENVELRSRIRALIRRSDAMELALAQVAPPKRLLHAALASFTFFSSCFVSETLLSVRVVMPFWNTLFMIVSFGFWIMGLVLEHDYRTLKGKAPTVSSIHFHISRQDVTPLSE